MPINVALVLPSVSAHRTGAASRKHYPYPPQGRPEIRPRASGANGNSLPLTPSQRYLVNRPLPPSLPLERTPRGSHPHGITYYVVAAVFLLPLEPQGILCLLGILPASATVLLILFMIAVLLLLTPFLLIVEPRAGKVQAERLKEP